MPVPQEINLGNRSVTVEWIGRGNTDGDVIVRLPDDKMLITGDLLVAPVPYAFDSPMIDWVETLERLASYDVETIVPGHGAVQTDTAYLELVQDLLEHMLELVQAAHDAGVAYADLADAVDLSQYADRFAGDDAELAFAWNAYLVSPGLASAWKSLGFPVPEDETS